MEPTITQPPAEIPPWCVETFTQLSDKIKAQSHLIKVVILPLVMSNVATAAAIAYLIVGS